MGTTDPSSPQGTVRDPGADLPRSEADASRLAGIREILATPETEFDDKPNTRFPEARTKFLNRLLISAEAEIARLKLLTGQPPLPRDVAELVKASREAVQILNYDGEDELVKRTSLYPGDFITKLTDTIERLSRALAEIKEIVDGPIEESWRYAPIRAILRRIEQESRKPDPT